MRDGSLCPAGVQRKGCSARKAKSRVGFLFGGDFPGQSNEFSLGGSSSGSAVSLLTVKLREPCGEAAVKGPELEQGKKSLWVSAVGPMGRASKWGALDLGPPTSAGSTGVVARWLALEQAGRKASQIETPGY